jgi:hypothetical protein
VQIIECLSDLAVNDFLSVTNPRTGIHTICKFLPSVAEVHEFIRLEHERRDQFKPAHTTYHRFAAEPEIDIPPLERRKQVVRETLGYDPQHQRRKEEPAFKPGPSIHGDHRDLQTPARPASDELKRLIASA